MKVGQTNKMAQDLETTFICDLHFTNEDRLNSLERFLLEYFLKPSADHDLAFQETVNLALLNYVSFKSPASKTMEKQITPEFHKLFSDLKNYYEIMKNIIGESTRLKETREDIWTVCFGRNLKTANHLYNTKKHREFNVLILGETGTGKEATAKAIAGGGDTPYIAMNVSAISESLIESELFGHEKGAFTGAGNLKEGFFEKADGGSLFLDEIGDLPLNIQVKLLRAIEEQQIYRVGGNKKINIDVKIITSTNKPILEMVEQGLFRRDLFARITTGGIVKTFPLRERIKDIYLIAEDYGQKNFSGILDMEELEEWFESLIDVYLKDHLWLGNVREVQQAVKMFAQGRNENFVRIAAEQDRINEGNRTDGSDSVKQIINCSVSIDDLKKWYAKRALKIYGNLNKTAKVLGISRQTVSNMVKTSEDKILIKR